MVMMTQISTIAPLLLDSGGAPITHISRQPATQHRWSTNAHLQLLDDAIRGHNLDDVHLVLWTGAVDVNSARLSTTALMLAVQGGSLNIARCLLASGARVDQLSMHPHSARLESPLLTACRSGDANMAQLLLEHNADPNAADVYQQSALWLSVERRDRSITELLVEHGANLNVGCRRPLSPLYMSVKFFGGCRIARLLVEHGAKTDTKDMYGQCTLYWALVNGHYEMAAYLINVGCHVTQAMRVMVRVHGKGGSSNDDANEQDRGDGWRERLMSYFTNPPSLINLAAREIRINLCRRKRGTSIWPLVDRLYISKVCADYLKHMPMAPIQS